MQKRSGKSETQTEDCAVYQPNNNCSVINQSFVYQWRTRPLALLTKQMFYVSYKLNFTPGFLLIRGPSGGSCPPTQHGKRTQQRRPQSLTRCQGDVEKWDEREREQASGEKIWIIDATPRMEKDYFMVIVWCLILNCNNKFLILRMGWIFDDWKRQLWLRRLARWYPEKSHSEPEVIESVVIAKKHVFGLLNPSAITNRM